MLFRHRIRISGVQTAQKIKVDFVTVQSAPQIKVYFVTVQPAPLHLSLVLGFCVGPLGPSARCPCGYFLKEILGLGSLSQLCKPLHAHFPTPCVQPSIGLLLATVQKKKGRFRYCSTGPPNKGRFCYCSNGPKKR